MFLDCSRNEYEYGVNADSREMLRRVLILSQRFHASIVLVTSSGGRMLASTAAELRAVHPRSLVECIAFLLSTHRCSFI